MPEIIRIVALTLFMEAAGEGFDGQYAVASVIWNRANGDTSKLVAVCKKPKQFSCWNNRTSYDVPTDYASLVAWNHSLRLATAMVDGTFRPLHNATHYHAIWMKKYPSWASKMKYVTTIGKHIFYV
jgi:spore germination cell wall hydrolase CwlJ-like protein